MTRQNTSPPSGQEGLVIARFGKQAEIETPSGKRILCHLRRNSPPIVTGDRVLWEPLTEQEGVVLTVNERHTLLERSNKRHPIKRQAIAANIDQMCIVSAAQPELDEMSIDRYLVAAETSGIMPCIIFNKIDLLDKERLASVKKRLVAYQQLGYAVIYTSTKANEGITQLEAQLTHKVNVFVGQSGVGKSSLIKRILPDEDIATRALTPAELGAHTTTVTRLFHLTQGGDLIDSPGIRELTLVHLDKDALTKGFKEFRPYLGQCKFRDCSHTQEPGCALLAAVESGHIHPERHLRYKQLIEN